MKELTLKFEDNIYFVCYKGEKIKSFSCLQYGKEFAEDKALIFMDGFKSGYEMIWGITKVVKTDTIK